MRTGYRPELPPEPRRIQRLPLDARGYPVPWFCVWLDDDENVMPRGEGKADFRVLYPNAVAQAVRESRCWICGRILFGRRLAYVAGPMCAINRTSAEPPSHEDCAHYAARACPFLGRPHMVRRTAGMPATAADYADVPGIMLDRNPGATMVWVTDKILIRQLPDGGILFDIGDPKQVDWYAEGRPATREEVEHSIGTGIHHLYDLCDMDSEPENSRREVTRRRDALDRLLPA